MSIALFLKNNLKSVPPFIGTFINRIPYSKRPGIGRIYRSRKIEIDLVEEMDGAQKQEYVLQRLASIVSHAYYNIRFYKDLYDRYRFHPNDLRKFDDIQKIPVVTKRMLNEYDIEDRSFHSKNRYLVNTGGSSGSPFGFYIEPTSIGHEWAHMHTIWERLGYKCSDLKIVFGGRSDVKELVEYDVVRNHFAIDLYAPLFEVAQKLKKITNRYEIKFLHGYPSAIYDFAVYCAESDNELLYNLRKTLKGVFYGSEYPHGYYRQRVEEIFGVQTISWYGHTERAVLAYEKAEKFKYHPFLTYGFSEAIPNGAGDYSLVSTSYYNRVSPLIRYNTEDTIENPIINDSILKSFNILKGRDGEFVVDNRGTKVNLTALIFGRHHKLFNHCKFIQVKQISPGKLDIHYVGTLEPNDAQSLFDHRNLAFELRFIKESEPVRTISGKINLLIKK